MKNLFYTWAAFFLLSNSSSFARPPLELLEAALKDNPHCLAIAKKAVSDGLIYSEEPFEWKQYFKLDQEGERTKADIFHKAVGDYLTVWVKDLFESKRALKAEDIEWKQIEDEYKMLVGYKDSIIEGYTVALCDAGIF